MTVKLFFVISKIEKWEDVLASPGQLMDCVAKITGSNRSTVESIYNQLRDEDVIPKGARGKNALQVTSEHAAKLLIAVCTAEHVKDAAASVHRYSMLDAAQSRRHSLTGVELITPSSEWEIVKSEYPRLAKLPKQHALVDGLIALIDSFIEGPARSSSVTVNFGSPYPSAEATVSLQQREDREWRVTVMYQHVSEDSSGEDDDPDFLAMIDPAKERQRRRFSSLGGDLRITAKITEATFAALGDLLR